MSISFEFKTCSLIRIHQLLLGLLFSSISFSVHSQLPNMDRPVAPSSETIAFTKFIDYPVDFYTGLVDISVPIYTIGYKDISVPLVLNYHASGIQVAAQASWVGLGWNLSGRGFISREIRGKNDMAFVQDDVSNQGFYNYQGFPLDPEIPETITNQYLTDICDNDVDNEPDIFHFVLPDGTSGKFILEKQSALLDYVEATLLVPAKIQIRYYKNDLHWEVKTANGFRYVLGTRELTQQQYGSSGISEIEADRNVAYMNAENTYVTTWHLDYFISAKNHRVDYEYDLPSGKYRYAGTKISRSELYWTYVLPCINWENAFTERIQKRGIVSL
ncbi:MAG: hypothetical protein AAGF85_21355 [Bacteroidota bacterium]